MPRRRNRWTERLDARLGQTIDDIFLGLPAEAARALFGQVPPPILARPRVIRSEQEAYFQKVCLDLTRALERLPALYTADERVQALLPFTEREQRWLRETWRQGGDAHETLLARLDTNADLSDDEWDDEPQVLGAALGGMADATRVSEVLLRAVVPVLHAVAPALAVKAQEDALRLISEQIAVHAQAVRRHSARVATVDPRELFARGDELYAPGVEGAVDIVARDCPMATFIALEDGGADLSALKHAFLKNQVVSSVAAEFLHASCFEVLTTPELATAHFTQRQQRLFRHHVPWTRIVRDTRTTDADGAQIELLPWLRRHKDQLVLKANRGGGAGVVLGPHVDLAQWDAALAQAHATGAVAQRYIPLPVVDFPLLGPGDDGRVALEQLYVVCSFLATDRGVSILGRAAKRRAIDMTTSGLAGVLVLA